MRIGWLRDPEDIDFNRPNAYFVLGTRGSGKSSLLEHVGEIYLSEDQKILDLFGSRDGESLAWLRSPYAKDRKILLIHGDNASVQSSFDSKNISKVTLDDFRTYDILVSSSPLYSSIDDEFFHVNRLIDILYKRLSWNDLIYMIVREAANLFYARLRISSNQLAAKAECTYLIREARHCGVALALDTLKYTSIDIDIRSVMDYTFFKSQGVLGLPDNMGFLYGWISPAVMRNMPAKYFAVLSRKGAVGLGYFPEVEWHKRERENILRSVGVKVEYGDQIEYGQSRGLYKTVSDQEHLDMVSAYFEGVSMGKIAEKLNRSAATIHTQIHMHDKSIEKVGYCVECRRMKGVHETDKTEKRFMS